MKGKQVYFTRKELEAMCAFCNRLEEICIDEETYAHWLSRVGSSFEKIFNAKNQTTKKD